MAKDIQHRDVTVTENGLGRYQQQVTTGPHALIADEPASIGGGDAGPTPYEYLMAALGACTSMTLRMYAELKQLPLENVRVEVAHRKDEVEGRGKVDRFTRRIALSGPLTPEQRARMLEIANRCPVHRTLTGDIEIDSHLVD